ncbi:amidohydrolase family protein [Corynebacterium suedekumii]|nr:amidohydrolase family protein [Corynebacterium suedekumii]
MLRERLIGAHLAGWQLAVHAIGDAAVDTILDIIAEAQSIPPRDDARHRLEHVSVVSDEQIARIRELGLTVVPQGRFIPELGDGVIEAVGEKRLPLVYRAKGFLDQGVEMAGSTDAPVVAADPILNIAALVNRTTAKGATSCPRNASPSSRPSVPTPSEARKPCTRRTTRVPWHTASSPTSRCCPRTSSPWRPRRSRRSRSPRRSSAAG